MKIIRILLFPFSIIYGVIVSIRNLFFDWGILKSTSFELPIITVGNLSVGGTGKTPQIEYLTRLLKDKYSVAILSRGYKRKTEGFVLADEAIKMEAIGDEPYQYFKKFKNIQVAVDAKRVNGVSELLSQNNKPEVILLDDAYQHRHIKAGYHVLLTAYSDLFYKDFMLPTGNLRELWWGKNRAEVIVVTKCPDDLSDEEQEKITRRIKPKKNQQVFFTKIGYANSINSVSDERDLSSVNKVLLITGIAKPKPLVIYLKGLGIEVVHKNYDDHYNFTDEDILQLQQEYNFLKSNGYTLLTTEKDFMRLEGKLDDLYYLSIQTEFLNRGNEFGEKIFEFVKGY